MGRPLGRKCPRAGVRVRHPGGDTGVVTKVLQPSGQKKACAGDLVYVQWDAGMVIGVPRDSLERTRAKGGLGSLSDVWRMNPAGREGPPMAAGRVVTVQPGDYVVNEQNLEPIRLPQYRSASQLLDKLQDEWALAQDKYGILERDRSGRVDLKPDRQGQMFGVQSTDVPQLVIDAEDAQFLTLSRAANGYKPDSARVVIRPFGAHAAWLSVAVYGNDTGGLLHTTVPVATAAHELEHERVYAESPPLVGSVSRANMDTIFATLTLSPRAREALSVWLDRLKERGLAGLRGLGDNHEPWAPRQYAEALDPLNRRVFVTSVEGDHAIVVPAQNFSRGLPLRVPLTSLRPLRGLGMEWDGSPQPGRRGEPGRRWRVVPHVGVETKPQWASTFFPTGILFKDINPALAKYPGDLVPVPEWNHISKSYIEEEPDQWGHESNDPGAIVVRDGIRHKLWPREDLQLMLAAEDHYRGIMPPETTFKGLGSAKIPPQEQTGDGRDDVIKLTHVELADYALRETRYVHATFVVAKDGWAARPGEQFSTGWPVVGIRFPGKPPYFRWWRLDEALVQQLTRLARGEAVTWETNRTLRIVQPRDLQMFSVWLDGVLERHQYMRHAEFGSLGSTDAEHATDFDTARFELVNAVNDAQLALRQGQCRVASTLVGEADVNYGRLQANAMTTASMGTALDLFKQLAKVQTEFDEKCVRDEPVSESYDRTMRAMRPGLAGARMVTIPAAHLREDVKEARGMVKELQRGIKRDVKALGSDIGWFPKAGRDALDPMGRVVYIVRIDGDMATVKLGGSYGAHVQVPVTALREPPR